MNVVAVASAPLMAPPKRWTASLGRAGFSQKVRFLWQTKIRRKLFRQTVIQLPVVIQRPLTALDITMDTDCRLKTQALPFKVRVRHCFKVLIPQLRIGNGLGWRDIRRLRATIPVKSATAFHHLIKRREGCRLWRAIRQKSPQPIVIHPAPIITFLVTVITDLAAQALDVPEKMFPHFIHRII